MLGPASASAEMDGHPEWCDTLVSSELHVAIDTVHRGGLRTPTVGGMCA